MRRLLAIPILLLLLAPAMAGELTPAPTGSGGITVGGSITGGTDTRCLFNDAGAIGEDAGCTYVKGTDTITLLGAVISPVHSTDNANPADAGIFRLGNAESIAWEADPAGTDVTLTVDSSEVLQIAGGRLDGADLADSTVLEVSLKAVNTPTDEYMLTYESTTGDFEWQAVSSGATVIQSHIGGSFSPADSTVLYAAWAIDAPQTTESHLDWFMVTTAGTVTKACLMVSAASGTVGSNEAVTMLVRKNLVDTAMTWTGTWDGANNTAQVSCTTSNTFTVVANDILTIKITPPAWATNPTGLRMQAWFIVQ